MDTNTNYMIFVLGYDLLHDKLVSLDDCPCDWAYEACEKVYEEFLNSEEAKENKSEYECLQEWINTHTEMIDYILYGKKKNSSGKRLLNRVYYKESDGWFDFYINVKTGEKKLKLDENDICIERKVDDFYHGDK